MDLIIKAIMLHPHASDGKADMLPVSPNWQQHIVEKLWGALSCVISPCAYT
jgi:hypothetical protein